MEIEIYERQYIIIAAYCLLKALKPFIVASLRRYLDENIKVSCKNMCVTREATILHHHAERAGHCVLCSLFKAYIQDD